MSKSSAAKIKKLHKIDVPSVVRKLNELFDALSAVDPDVMTADEQSDALKALKTCKPDVITDLVKRLDNIVNAKEKAAWKAQQEVLDAHNAKIAAKLAKEKWERQKQVLEVGFQVAKEEAELAEIGRVVRNAYLEEIRGRQIGTIWTNEFEQYRRNGAYEESLFGQLIAHGKTTEPLQVKNFVSNERLIAMMVKAEIDAGGAYCP